MLERSMLAFALLGAEWVLYLLVILSVFSVAIMVERGLFFARRRDDLARLRQELSSKLADGDLEGARAVVRDQPSMAAQVAAAGLAVLSQGRDVAQHMMEGEMVRLRTVFESRLIFLGTLGNNAPFIGLFGTVLGIIKAFRDLAQTQSAVQNSSKVVMAGISEALVATAVGLFVALPAVVAFNYFKSIVKHSVSSSESLSRVVTAYAPNRNEGSAPGEVS